MRTIGDGYRKPGLAPGFFCLLALAACSEPPAPAATATAAGMPARLTLAGRIDAPDLDELSGMARSALDPGRLWLHNDSGDKARLYAVDTQGRYLGRLKLEDADNVDWEDLASFSLAGRPYLLVADIGDNDGRRDFVSLYVVAEPATPDHATAPDWRIDFRYPDGPRDAEAVAADADEGFVYILTKRDLPPLLYRVPLQPAGASPVIAERLGPVALPRPGQRDLKIAALAKDWHWQPTAMDIAADGTFVVVLTYGAVYYFHRETGNELHAALAAPPLRFPLRNLHEAEALAVSADGLHLYLSAEGAHAPLYRIDRQTGPAPQDQPASAAAASAERDRP